MRRVLFILPLILMIFGGCKDENIKLNAVSLSEDIIVLTKGETFQLKCIFEPLDASKKAVLWESSDDVCVRIDQKGLVTAMGKGNAVIRVTAADGGFKDSCTVEVKGNESSLLSIEILDVDLVPSFLSETDLYAMIVTNETTKISLKAQLADVDAKLYLDGNKIEDEKFTDDLNLVIGKNIFELRVVAEDGIEERIYTLSITREEKALIIVGEYTGDKNFLGDEEFKFDFLINDSSINKIKLTDGNALISKSYSPVEIAVDGETEFTYMIYIYPSENKITLAGYSDDELIKAYEINVEALR